MFTPVAISNTFILRISANTSNFVLGNMLVSLGWNGTSPTDVNITVDPGVIIYSTNVSTVAFNASLPAGSTLFLTIGGGAYIVGKGGTGGGPGGTAVTGGGTALFVNCATQIINNGVIGGGGGGGGAGGTSGCDTSCSSGCGCCCGGYASGGGGAGYGAAGSGYNSWYACSGFGGSYTYGNAGALTTGGPASIYSGTGGALGQPGSNGTQAGAICGAGPGAGGAGGNYISGFSNVTWLAAGTRLGGAV